MRNAWHITVASIYWSVSLCQDCLKHCTCTNSSNPILLFITCHYLFPYYKWGDWDTEGVMCPRSHSIQTIETIIQTKAVNMETFFQGAGVVHWVIEALTSLSWSWEILACFLYIVDTWVIVFWGRFFSCCPHLGKFLSGKWQKQLEVVGGGSGEGNCHSDAFIKRSTTAKIGGEEKWVGMRVWPLWVVKRRAHGSSSLPPMNHYGQRS